jgi:arylsulfatase A-like enzyme
VQSAPVKPTVNSRPNILFILTDDQRYDSVAQLPKLNARTDWLRFQKSFAEEPQCCPSRATIFTGRYSHHTNVQTLLEGRNLDDTRTIATTLDSVGYHTGFLGKYLNGYPFGVDLEPPPGWDNFESYGHSAAYYDYYVYRNGTRVDYGSAPADYSTDVWTNRASKFLNSADPAKPFFLEVAYNSPHFSTTGTAIPAPRDVGTCANQSFPLPASFNAHDFNSEPPWLAAIPNRSAGGMQYQRRQTCEALRSVDDGVSSLLAQLTSLGRLSNTYVVLMSDNGYAFGEHRLTGKGDLYEASIRVPLMVRGPGVVPGTTNRLTSNVDLVPTFLSWAKTSAPPGFVDGVSWAANAHGTAGATNPTSVLLRGCRTSLTDHPGFCGGDPGPSMGMNWGIRTASYKLVEYPSGYKQLFDLVDDPHELHNLAADPSKSGVIANLHAQLVTRRGF